MPAKSEIVSYCQRLYAKNLIAGNDGNVSVRQDSETILITPKGRHKGFLQSHEIAAVSLSGKTLVGEPSSELFMHLAVFRACSDARAVIHAHPIAATAWSVANPDLEYLATDCLTESLFTLGRVPIVPYARPGTMALADTLLPYLQAHQVMILKQHGSLVHARSLHDAFCLTEHLEHTAKTLFYAHNLGGLHALDERV